MAYNAGPNLVRKWQDGVSLDNKEEAAIKESQVYADKVLAGKGRFSS